MNLPPPKLESGPWIMGVVNVTPDSFSDGGRFVDPGDAIDHAMALIAEGADVLDIGGESTRPGAAPVHAEEEIARTAPLIEKLRARAPTPISIDTMKPEVARAAFAAGASIWNDVAALRFTPDAPQVAADLGGIVMVMHMQGEPRTMQTDPAYGDVVAEVIAFLNQRVAAAEAAGVARDQIWIDPGIGFGKTLAHNLALMRALGEIKVKTGRPLLFGASRKSFIAAIDKGASADQRLGGSLAAALHAARCGADMIRVHDVRATAQALAVWKRIG